MLLPLIRKFESHGLTADEQMDIIDTVNNSQVFPRFPSQFSPVKRAFT